MIIDITQSKFFTEDPDLRFSKEYLLPQGTWRDLWRRHKLLEYTNRDLRDYLFVKHARSISRNGMERWIARSEIYMVSRPVLEKGAKAVNTEIFGNYEQYVMDELTKQIRFGGHGSSKSII